MAELLIIYHSRTGGSLQMAQAAHEAAGQEVSTRILRACDVEPEDLRAASGYLFVAPENLAALSGEMKEMFDRCYYPLLGQIEGRPYAQMICAGSDGQGAVRQLARIATGWRLREVQPPVVICTHADSPKAILAEKTLTAGQLTPCRALGTALGAGLAMGIF
ncbi:flavodoxin family protein [Aliiroseovarius marinus]|uniref:flavodoxin family protein n=1 Tax=Aliiroseovarius marinus TaxID=2500159 RepID=UPI003D7D4661